MINPIISLDQFLEQFLFAHRTPELISFFSWITDLGDARIVAIVCISMAILLLRKHHFSYVAGLALVICGSTATSYILKKIVERPRPFPPIPAIFESGYSFPSLHATGAFALYGFLIYMIYKLLLPPHHRKALIALLSLLIVLIGFSRLYLGVHYLSDVLAGFVVGSLFLWLGTQTTIRLERQSKKQSDAHE